MWNFRRTTCDQAAGKTHLRFRVLEDRVVGSNHQVTHLYQNIGTTDTIALHAGNDWLVCDNTDAGHTLPHFFWRAFDVSANRKSTIALRAKYCASSITCIKCLQRTTQTLDCFFIQGVEFFRSIQTDNRSAVLFRVCHDIGHFYYPLKPSL